MAGHKKTTYFASAERTDKEGIEKEHEEILDHVHKDPFTCRIIDSVMEIVIILDKNRQVVFSNEALHKLLGSKDGSEFRKCGAVISFLSAQEDKPRTEECTVVQRGTDNAIELAVSAVPLDVDGERYTLFVILDVSDQKRREAMERIFFHDVLNTSAVLSGLAEILQMGKDDRFPDLRGSIYKTTLRLVEELQAQRALTLAEKGELYPHVEHIHSHDLLQGTIQGYLGHDVAKDKALELDASSEDVELDIDPTILHRVVGNMIKNALEASEKGEHVKVGGLKKDGFAEFWVH
jgi:signal transduction histidine kinase